MSAPVSPERRRQLSRAGRIGGLRRWIIHPDLKDDVSRARATYDQSFLSGHGCAACGPYVAIPAHLPSEQQERLSKSMRRKHFQRLADRAVAKRRAQS